MDIHVRNARLKGIKEATRVLRLLEARERMRSTDCQVDVFGALADLDIRVLFKPLGGLLGAFLRQPSPGVLISNKRRLSVQRFTAAHELGHAVMNHEPSLDSKGVLRRAGAGQYSTVPALFKHHLQEIEADAFAAELLAPRWLITFHANLQGWSAEELAVPDVAYQLSLRCGCSYEAIAYSLERNAIITGGRRASLLRSKPKQIKARVREDAEWLNPWADVWHLSERDVGLTIPVSVGDLVRISLAEQPANGRRRALGPLPSTLKLLGEHGPNIGQAVELARAFVVRPDAGGPMRIEIGTDGPSSPMELSIDLNVREPESGLSRANRAKLAQLWPMQGAT